MEKFFTRAFSPALIYRAGTCSEWESERTEGTTLVFFSNYYFFPSSLVLLLCFPLLSSAFSLSSPTTPSFIAKHVCCC